MWIDIVLALVLGALCVLPSLKLLHMLQLESYRVRGLLNWVRCGRSPLLFCHAFSAAFGTLCAMALGLINPRLAYAGLAVTAGLHIYWCVRFCKEPVRVSIKFTPRMIRLTVCLSLASAACAWGLISAAEYLGAAVTALLLPLVIVAQILIAPVEWLDRYKYIVRARRKLRAYPKLIKIGITGSYGKTSVKNILTELLSVKLRVCASPASYNTPMGLCRVVNDNLSPDDEILICEMGARRRGDIRALTRIVRPDIAIITAVGNQHLQSFKTVQNIAQTKYEIVEGANTSGFAVFNGGCEAVLPLFELCPIRKILACARGASAAFDGVSVSREGSKFRLIIKGQMINCTTPLLGVHNIVNITVAAAVAYELGVSLADIARVVARLKPSPHRLELLHNPHGLVIIDDSYNASAEGVRAALDVLTMFEGGRIVVTPGLVELGAEQERQNILYGNALAKVATAVILCGGNASGIREGLIQKGFDVGNIYLSSGLEQSQQLLAGLARAGDAVLFANDLPDNLL